GTAPEGPAGRRARIRARTKGARVLEIGDSFASASADLSGLHRDQALQCGRRGDWRAWLPRHVYVGRVHRTAGPNSDLAQEDRQHPRALRTRSERLRREEPDARARDVPARRVVPKFRRRIVRDRPGRHTDPRAPPNARVRTTRSLRPILYVPRVHA